MSNPKAVLSITIAVIIVCSVRAAKVLIPNVKA